MLVCNSKHCYSYAESDRRTSIHLIIVEKHNKQKYNSFVEIPREVIQQNCSLLFSSLDTNQRRLQERHSITSASLQLHILHLLLLFLLRRDQSRKQTSCSINVAPVGSASTCRQPRRWCKDVPSRPPPPPPHPKTTRPLHPRPSSNYSDRSVLRASCGTLLQGESSI